MKDYEIEIYEEEELEERFPNIYKYCKENSNFEDFSQAIWVEEEGFIVTFISEDSNSMQDFIFKKAEDTINGNLDNVNISED
jgi:uncharacterized membrane-anchored protein YjiN (DUF445 family)